jgi:hypothetical protein
MSDSQAEIETWFDKYDVPRFDLSECAGLNEEQLKEFLTSKGVKLPAANVFIRKWKMRNREPSSPIEITSHAQDSASEPEPKRQELGQYNLQNEVKFLREQVRQMKLDLESSQHKIAELEFKVLNMAQFFGTLSQGMQKIESSSRN